jgi:hypothetical protein
MLGDEAFAEADEIGSLQEAVGEAGCGTVQCSAANSCFSSNVNGCFAYPAFVPGNGQYGTPSCPNQVVAQDTTPGVGGQIRPEFRWQGATLTQANCASATAQLSLFAKIGNAPIARVGGIDSYVGFWQNGSCIMRGTLPKPQVAATQNLRVVRATGTARLAGVQQNIAVGFVRVCQ